MYPKNDIEKSKMRNVSYAQVIESLMYAMTSTRPNICYVVGLVTRF